MNDEIVPPSQTEALFNAATVQLKLIHHVPQGTHNDTWIKGGKDYIYAIKDFIDKT